MAKIRKESIIIFIILAFFFIYFSSSDTHIALKKRKTKYLINNLEMGLILYYKKNNDYPNQEEGLRSILPFLEDQKDPLHDAWGNKFIYIKNPEEKSYELISYGADNRLGGNGDNEDISSLKL